MKRTLMGDLIAWKTSDNRKPLLLAGPRQTGKTWLLREFGRQNFDSVAEVNLRTNMRAREIFSGDFNIERIVSEIAEETGTHIEAGNTLLILDDIHEVPHALASLEHFRQDMPNLHVAAASSFLGIAQHEGVSLPVDHVDSLTLEPLSFIEFLDALGKDDAAATLREAGATGIDSTLASELEQHLKDYLYVGGMPEVVDTFITTHDLARTRDIQERIVGVYELDFFRHAPVRILERIRLVWESIPAQLSREKKKFVYGVVRPGARGRDFEEAIDWLVDYGVLRRVWRSNMLRSPLSSYQDAAAFKLFCVDVGLLGAIQHLDSRVISDGTRIFSDLNRAYTEQYVCQQLITCGMQPTFWSSNRGRAEIDFVVEVAGTPVPIEVQASENLQTKSLKVARDRFRLNRCVRTSLAGLHSEGWLVNVPLWAIGSGTLNGITR